jgi:predicted nucleic acid-binding protein
MALQNVIEFWNVTTRPATARGGYGMTVTQADARARLLERAFIVLPDTSSVYAEWRRLVVAFTVSGVQVHDARLVATMRVHGVTRILTFNTADFARYPGITALHPAQV